VYGEDGAWPDLTEEALGAEKNCIGGGRVVEA
jgi:hypothetical protein